ncbi:M23 family metallopeptidase [Brachybacterium sp. EE-P12]|uniref:M23 family metallopeptidase n=1 Tax=Brachybacterium sp. EE-P12 TaxID=2306299 RepID=UPI001F1534B3|nr:M23 family metallopeptidase [Brachybacterium sp. EE-P12]
MANHRADGRATVRKHRAVGGTHRDAALPASAVKVGVLGVLATATIAAPLAAAAAGIDESAPTDSLAQAAQEPAAPQAAAAEAAAAIAPVELPGATEAALEERSDGEAASRSEERTAPAEEAGDSEGTGIEVSVPEPEPVATEEQAGAEDGESADAGSSDSGYIRPASGPITSGYGGRVHPVLGYYKGHDGVDFGAACGAPAKAAKSGTVVAVEYHHASGNRVKIDHGNGVITGYYHLQGFNTSVGAKVSQGDVIGYVGSTGRSTGCHLHFAKMDEAGNYSDPMSLLR